jgi:hypothetical protein
MACHFLKDKKISISLRRRFQFWLLSVLSVFTSLWVQRDEWSYGVGAPELYSEIPANKSG